MKTRDHRVMRWPVAALGSVLVGAVIGLGCSHPGVFRCESNEQCQDGERQGVCTDARYCAFEDESCASGLEYGALAEPELAGTCVPVGGSTGPTDEPGSEATSSSSSSTDPPAASDETGPSPACPVGEACEPEDPCAIGGTCDADGQCVPTGHVSCGEPGEACRESPGECQPDGSCAYPPSPPESECEDGDPCTTRDACDGKGACVPGPTCPLDNPCKTVECTDEGCVYSQAANGSSCGAAASQRCCNGDCVDISSDPLHCGGCDAACADENACESVAATSECMGSPADTTGRCRCQMADDECPLGQLCRTQTPYAGRCAPADAAGCDGDFVEVELCPNYCSY